MRRLRTYFRNSPVLVFCQIAFLLVTGSMMAAPVSIDSGHPILDDNGNFVHAHGGGMIKVGDYHYWFGENRNFNGDDTFHAVSCYRSTNLRDWEFRNHVLLSSDDADLDHAKIERPKVIYNAATGRFVMWMHKEWGGNYNEARAAVASCDTVDGHYDYHGSFRPLDTHMSRDCTLFIDDDGKGYFLSAANENLDLNLYRLTDDFRSIASLVKVITPGWSRESPCLFKRNGRYFIISSGTSGWFPNQAKFSTATSLEGPWSDPVNFSNGNTYSSQSAYVLTIQGTETTSYLYIGDRWARAWADYTSYSRYVFLPLHFPTDSVVAMDDAGHVTVDLETGYLAAAYNRVDGWEKVDDGSRRVAYSAGWLTYYGNAGYGMTEHYSETTGAVATFDCHGDRIRVHGARRNDLGIMEILIDGTVAATVDCYRSSAQYGATLYESDLLPRGPHTVEVRVTGTKNPLSSGTELVVDAFSSRDLESSVPPPSGPCRIVNSLSGKDLTVAPAGAGLTQSLWGDLAGQRWHFAPQQDGSHLIGSPESGLWMDVAGQSTAVGATLALNDYHGGDSQFWQVRSTPGGAFKLLNAGSQLLADMNGNSREDGASAIQYSENGGENQRWRLLPERSPYFTGQQIIEAESAASQELFSPFTVDAAGTFPGATCITVPDSSGAQAGDPAAGICRYSFTTTGSATRVRCWLLARATDTGDDNLHLRVNDEAWANLRMQQHPSHYLWHFCKESRLAPGEHTLSLGWGDGGIKIDKIMLQFLNEDPVIIDSAVTGTDPQRQMQLTWSSASGLTYAVESSGTLAPDAWETVASGISATPPHNTWESPALTGTKGFFRVRREP